MYSKRLCFMPRWLVGCSRPGRGTRTHDRLAFPCVVSCRRFSLDHSWAVAEQQQLQLPGVLCRVVFALVPFHAFAGAMRGFLPSILNPCLASFEACSYYALQQVPVCCRQLSLLGAGTLCGFMLASGLWFRLLVWLVVSWYRH